MDLHDLLLTAWKGVRRDLPLIMDDTDSMPSDNTPYIDPTTVPTTDPTNTLPALVSTALLMPSAKPSAAAAAVYNGLAGEPGSVPKMTKSIKTGSVTAIHAHFMEMPPQCCTSNKRPRDAQVRSQGAPPSRS